MSLRLPLSAMPTLSGVAAADRSPENLAPFKRVCLYAFVADEVRQVGSTWSHR